MATTTSPSYHLYHQHASPALSPPPSSSSRPLLPTIRLWPPNPSTRSTLVKRLSDHLSSVSFFSQRYGRISPSEAAIHAERIEDEAFQAASKQVGPDDDSSSDIAVVQFYAKEASRLMLECLKIGPSAPATSCDAGTQSTGEPSAVDTVLPTADSDQSLAETIFDVSGGSREFLTEEMAEVLLKPLTVPGTCFSSICLSNRSFGEDAAKVAGRVLTALRSQLVHVNLADIVAGRPEEEALAVMSIFSCALEGCKLKLLNLSDNALGEKGVRAFSELLKSQHSLEELYFINNGISEEAALAICDLLPSASKLRVLHFHNNMTGDAGAVALSDLVKGAPVLEDFRCSSTRVATEGGVALAEALLAGNSLKKVDLRDNPVGLQGGLALAKTLKMHMDLKEVYLSYLGFEDEGSIAVLEALECGAPDLQVLELAGNDMTVKSARNIANCVASKPRLVRLNLSENELQDTGVVVISDALHNHDSLVELDLCETDVGRIGACAAAKAVAQKQGFKLLSLNGNHISEAGIEALKFTLQEGSGGAKVLGPLDENDEDDDGNANNDEDSYEESEGEPTVFDEELQAQFGNVKV